LYLYLLNNPAFAGARAVKSGAKVLKQAGFSYIRFDQFGHGSK